LPPLSAEVDRRNSVKIGANEAANISCLRKKRRKKKKKKQRDKL